MSSRVKDQDQTWHNLLNSKPRQYSRRVCYKGCVINAEICHHRVSIYDLNLHFSDRQSSISIDIFITTWASEMDSKFDNIWDSDWLNWLTGRFDNIGICILQEWFLNNSIKQTMTLWYLMQQKLGCAGLNLTLTLMVRVGVVSDLFRVGKVSWKATIGYLRKTLLEKVNCWLYCYCSELANLLTKRFCFHFCFCFYSTLELWSGTSLKITCPQEQIHHFRV